MAKHIKNKLTRNFRLLKSKELPPPVKYFNNLASETIESLRFPMAVMIVFIHQNPIFYSEPSDAGEYLYNIIVRTFSTVLPSIAVPLFFLISGYLYFLNVNNFTKEQYFTKSKKRIKSLLLPYIFWNLIAFGVIIVQKLASVIMKGRSIDTVIEIIKTDGINIFWGSNSWAGGYWCFGLLNAPENIAPVDVPLWFLRNLIILAVFTPIIYWSIKKLDFWIILILGFAYLSKIWIQYTPLSITGIFYFTLGAYLSLKKFDIASCFEKYANLLFSLSTIFAVICIYQYSIGSPRIAAAILPIFTLSSVLSTIIIFTNLNRKGRTSTIKSLAQTSFFMFSIHTILINGLMKSSVNKFFSMITGTGTTTQLLSYFTSAILTISVCLIIFYMMKKTTPRLLCTLTGNRA